MHASFRHIPSSHFTSQSNYPYRNKRIFYPSPSTSPPKTRQWRGGTRLSSAKGEKHDLLSCLNTNIRLKDERWLIATHWCQPVRARAWWQIRGQHRRIHGESASQRNFSANPSTPESPNASGLSNPRHTLPHFTRRRIRLDFAHHNLWQTVKMVCLVCKWVRGVKTSRSEPWCGPAVVIFSLPVFPLFSASLCPTFLAGHDPWPRC